MIRTRLVALAVPALLALTGCSDDGLDVDGLPPGACTDVAPSLVDTDQALRQLADGDVEPAGAAATFARVQERLEAAEGGADPAVAPALVELRRQLALFRIAVDTGADRGEQDGKVRTAVDDLLTACRAG